MSWNEQSLRKRTNTLKTPVQSDNILDRLPRRSDFRGYSPPKIMNILSSFV